MPDFYDLCLALLAAVGVVCIVWTIAGFILRPGRVSALVLLCRAQDTDSLADAVQRFEWLQRWGRGDYRLVILLDGLGPEARRFAELYARGEPAVRICRTDELSAVISAEQAEYR